MLKIKRFFLPAIIAIVTAVSISAPAAVEPESVSADTGSIKITPDYRQTVARSQLAMINSWRSGSTWYYNKSNSKIYLNGLRALTYDYTLEKYAMQRAAEIALSFEHTRPTGTQRSGISGYLGIGENIAATTNPLGATASYALTMFQEEDKMYGGQGHRRMLLSVPADFDAIGIACVYYKGCYYWAQEFGVTDKPDTKVTSPVNGNRTMTVELETNRLTSNSVDLSELNNWTAKLNKGETDYLPDITLNLGMAESWPYASIPVTAIPDWSSSNTGVATVNSNYGTITGVNVGSTNLTVKEDISGISRTRTVSVTDPNAVTGVSLNKSSLSLNTNESSSLIATVSPGSASNKNVTWSSSNTGVATVSSSGVVSAKKAGTATITVRTVSGNKTATCKVTVSDVPVTGVTLDKSNMTISTGNSQSLKASVSPSNATNKNVTWSSSNNSVATVDANGLVRAVNTGNAVITCRTVSGGKSATCTVNVTKAVTGVRLDRSSMDIPADGAGKLSATVSPSDATDKTVTWSSSNRSVARVDSNGNVTAVSPGLTTITAATRDGGKTASCTVRVQFKDVADMSQWYYRPVYWAADQGITTGSNGLFSPDGKCTREQTATFLWRMVGKPEPASMDSKFSDVKNKNAYSYKAIMWASQNGIVTGSNGRFQPADYCTREQIMSILWRMAGKPEPSNSESPFRDVKNKSRYSYKAILWGVEKGITTGANGLFSPNGICLRREIVTFLYRYSRL